ncbi:efflux transporter outer membrane subunit [Acidovorax sp. A1169]|uniref:efflux transporter outer membrane subunit n=1 Tax=Acidovorax sp. A1169 TaxID=3059524 RepID=UPI0027379BA3|nr:efflux transporter outer membrane subunit [Acidovorax sp. A1169]MDP4076369.1 efflux transporter outer membrane subunit [Acidovorax sp. A1169]
MRSITASDPDGYLQMSAHRVSRLRDILCASRPGVPMTAWTLLTVLIWPLIACTTVQSLESSDVIPEIPGAWSIDEQQGAGATEIDYASLTAWWHRFDDPLLGVLVGFALKENTSIQGAQAALRQAQALREAAAASLWPTVSGSASAQRGVEGGLSTGSSIFLGLDANWAVDVFGARRAGVDVLDANAQASEASLGDMQVQIAAEVALNYILLRSAIGRSSIAGENLASQEETLQITLWRQQAGLTSSLEAEQARTAVALNKAQLPLLQMSIVQTQNALAVLTGRPPTFLPEILDMQVSGAAVLRVRDALPMSIPAQVLRQRADVRAAEYQVAAALARVGQARAQLLPSFTIGGSLGLRAATIGALTGSSAGLGSVLASVTLPILDGGALRAQLRAQQGALEQAQQMYRASVLAALKDVEDALVALRGDRLRLASLRIAAEAAGNAALLARQRYSSGLIDFQTVLETQRTQFATQDGAATASADVSRDHVRLFKALGGGWPHMLQEDQL